MGALIASLTLSLVAAGQGGRASAEDCSVTTLEQANRAFRAQDLTQAERLAESVRDCPQPLGKAARELLSSIEVKRENDRRWQRAQVLIQRGNLEEACALLYDIQVNFPDFPNLRKAKRDTGCTPGLEQLKELLSATDSLIEKGRWEEAWETLTDASARHPNHPEVQARMKRVGPARHQQRSDARKREYEVALRLFERGDVVGAKIRLQKFLLLKPDHSEAAALLEKVEVTLRADARLQAVDVLSEEARELLSIGDFAAAGEKVEEAIRVQGSNPGLEELRRMVAVSRITREAQELLDADKSAEAQAKIEEALSMENAGTLLIEVQDSIERKREESRLRVAVESYYAGKYTGTIAQLEGYVGEDREPRFSGLAHFFLGAALVSAALLSEQNVSRNLERANEHFRTGRQMDPEFNPPLESVSPRIQSVFSQAVSGTR